LFGGERHQSRDRKRECHPNERRESRKAQKDLNTTASPVCMLLILLTDLGACMRERLVESD
jgi:hypothetical protein